MLPLEREQDVLSAALDQVRSRLPAGWSFDLQDQSALFGPDAVVAVRGPDGDRATLVVEVKRSLVTRELASILEQLNGFIAAGPARSRDRGTTVPIVVARYIPEPLQAWMRERQLSYADATGNLAVALERPALFVRDVGAKADPWRGPGRPKGNLVGEPAARVVRALVDTKPPYSVPQLMEVAGTSSGPTYRVVEFLEDQDLLTREPRGPITDVRWRAVLERWVKDYGFSMSNTITPCLAPRGLPDLVRRLAQADLPPGLRYAVSGTVAAEQWAPYAPARNIMVYADPAVRLIEVLQLRETDAGANVLVASSPSDVPFVRTSARDGLVTVAPSQVAADLLTGPGRNPAEAEELLDWMEADESAWRR